MFLKQSEKRDNRLAGASIVLFFLLLSFFFCFPLLKDLTVSCRGDWDYFSHLYEAASVSLFEYGQLPLWNPYTGGGMPLFGNPQSGFASPIFLMTSLFGVLAGLKISVWLHTFLGLWGMWLLGGHLGIRGPARFAPPVIFMFTSSWAFHLAEGHIVWLPAALLPFLFLSFLKGLKDFRWLLAAAACESLMVYEGGTYVLAYALLFMAVYAGVLCLEARNWKPVVAFLAAGLMAAALSAPKLLPAWQLLAAHPRVCGVAESVSWDQFCGAFIERTGTMALMESNSYLGLPVVVLFLFSLFRVKKQVPLVAASLFLLLVSLGNFARYAPWTLLHSLPFFRNFQVPTRSLLVFCFSAALLVGLLLGETEARPSRLVRYLVGALVIFLGTDLFLLSSGILREAAKPVQTAICRFDGGPTHLEKPAQLYHVSPADSAGLGRSVAAQHRPFSQVRVPDLYRFAHGGWSDQYPHLLRNTGVVDAYETIPFDRQARAVTDSGYRGEYYLAGKGKGSVALKGWSPGKLVFRVALEKESRLVVNQNFWPGWHASRGTLRDHQGLLALDLSPGAYDVTLSYLPVPFLVGVGIFLLTIAAAATALALNARNRRFYSSGRC
jgi:xanthosine utilization system XapX-like protein